MTDLPVKQKKLRWCVDDIDFKLVDTMTVRNDEFLFLTLVSASFVEILSEMYSDNLIRHFGDNSAVTEWLRDYWQNEEVQHGTALKKYVQTVWPEFDWDSAHQAFCVEYGALCTAEQLESERALELLARCVIETGTATFYRALRSYANEPVLCQILNNISADETAHYNHFRKFFEVLYRSRPYGLRAVVATIYRRLAEIRSEDSLIAFKHAYLARYPERVFHESDFEAYNKKVRGLARCHYPYRMAVGMLLKPIPLFRPVKQVLQWPLLGLFYMLS